MRTFIRQPAEIAVEIDIVDASAVENRLLKNISFGGLCYRADRPVETGTKVAVRLPHSSPSRELEVRGKVSWCRQREQDTEIGVQFLPEDAENRVLLVEQVCELEHRRKERTQKRRHSAGP